MDSIESIDRDVRRVHDRVPDARGHERDVRDVRGRLPGLRRRLQRAARLDDRRRRLSGLRP